MIGPPADTIGLNQAVQVSGNVYVCRDSAGVIAVNITCTHSGCALVLKTDRNIWECPCHTSQFTISGLLIKGPAARNLPRHPVCSASDGRTRIDTSKLI